jgi:transcriptional regulator with XRE-family HTH domain
MVVNNSSIRRPPSRRGRGRASLEKTPLAQLRHLVGEHVATFAGMFGITEGYLWRLESGHKPLGEELALRIQKETAISAAWLLGHASRPPIDDMGDPYTLKTYSRRRAALAGKGGSLPKRGSVRGLLGAQVDAILAGAVRTHDESIFLYRLGQFLADAKADFGNDERVEGEGQRTALALKSLKDIFRERQHPQTEKPITGEYVVPEYREAREAFRKELTKLRKKARKPIALGMPASGPGILPILEIVAALVGIEKPWWFKDGDDHED